jgi:hypothetical protein
MPIPAVVFDIGGVEDTPAAGVAERWEGRSGCGPAS